MDTCSIATNVPTHAPTPTPTRAPTSAPSSANPTPMVTSAPTPVPNPAPPAEACQTQAVLVTGGWIQAVPMAHMESLLVDCAAGHAGTVVIQCQIGSIHVIHDDCEEYPTPAPTRKP